MKLLHIALHSRFSFDSDSVTFTVFLTHAFLSRDHAWNAVLVWILPHYARFLSHVPETNITSPYPGEYQIGVGTTRNGCLFFVEHCVSTNHALMLPSIFSLWTGNLNEA